MRDLEFSIENIFNSEMDNLKCLSTEQIDMLIKLADSYVEYHDKQFQMAFTDEVSTSEHRISFYKEQAQRLASLGNQIDRFIRTMDCLQSEYWTAVL